MPRFMTYLHAALYSLRINTRHIKQSTGIQNLDSASYLDEAVGASMRDHEQCAIATFLDRETARIDALVAKKQRLIELLQEQRTALITRAVTKGLDPTVPMKDSGVEWLGEIPEHWEVKKLKNVCFKSITYGIADLQQSRMSMMGCHMLKVHRYSRESTFGLMTSRCIDPEIAAQSGYKEAKSGRSSHYCETWQRWSVADCSSCLCMEVSTLRSSCLDP